MDHREQDCRITDQGLTEILLKANFQPGAIAAAMVSDVSDPSYQVAERVSQQLRKLQSVTAIRRSLLDLAFPSTGIERRTLLSSSEFLERYYAVNRPVVLSGLLSRTRACAAWTPEYLAAVCGQARVEIMAERAADANYEQKLQSPQTFRTHE